jgi:hypothetical protein
MVARINFASSLRNVMNYNENKMKQDIEVVGKDGKKEIKKKAEFIHSSGYAKDTHLLTFTNRFNRIKKLMDLRESRQRSVAHISLNFDPSEKHKLTDDMQKKIADDYMQKIGFGDQPYLVYKHNDAGHPHIHIVSTIIRSDGSDINTHLIGANVSEPARKQIELEYGLVVADKKTEKELFQLKPAGTAMAEYGRSETKREITNVLDLVVRQYKYSSLAELNAALRRYNVVADQGSEKSRVYKNNGLVYYITDQQGKKKSVPIKSSTIYFKPGIKYLQGRFKKNEPLKGEHKQRIRNAIDLALMKKNITTLQQLHDTLRRDNIHLVLRQSKDGKVSGLTVVDHYKMVVFKGTDLGTKFSAAAIQERLAASSRQQAQTQAQSQTQTTTHKQPAGTTQTHQKTIPSSSTRQDPPPKQEQTRPKSKETMKPSYSTPPLPATQSNEQPLLDTLLQQGAEQLPPDLTNTKKKKRKKRIHL